MEKISIREFARRVGRSDTNIRKAIESGVISASAVSYRPSGRPELTWQIAKADWDINGGGMQAVEKNLPDAQSNYQPKNKNSGEVKAPGPQTENTETKAAGNAKAPPSPLEMEHKGSILESRRISAQVEAQKAVLSLQQLKNILVKKEDVDTSCFNFGAMIKNTLIVIPDRIVDACIAAGPDRAKVHGIISKEINQVLVKLSTPPLLNAE